MFRKKIKIDEALWELLSRAAATTGASSVEELALSILAKEANKIVSESSAGDISDAEIDDITNKLKGLGYLE